MYICADLPEPLLPSDAISTVTGSMYIIHFYCLAIVASFYSGVVECLPVDPELGKIPCWDRLDIFLFVTH